MFSHISLAQMNCTVTVFGSCSVASVTAAALGIFATTAAHTCPAAMHIALTAHSGKHFRHIDCTPCGIAFKHVRIACLSIHSSKYMGCLGPR